MKTNDVLTTAQQRGVRVLVDEKKVTRWYMGSTSFAWCLFDRNKWVCGNIVGGYALTKTKADAYDWCLSQVD